MWFKMGMAKFKPSSQSDSAIRRVFLKIFFSELRPHRIAAIYREHRRMKRRPPALAFVWLLAALVFHALMGQGSLEQHVQEMTRKKISGSALSQRRQRLPWEIFRRIMDVVLVARAEVRKHPQAQRYLRAMWWALESAASFLNPKQVVAMITNGLEKRGSIYVSAPRRKRSCPREVRQPIGKWPRKIRNCSWAGGNHS
jgi:hypothetical protein